MNRIVQVGGLAAAAALIAHAAWVHPDALFVLAFLPLLLVGAERRGDASWIMAGYFGYNSLELPTILLRFFSGEHVFLSYAAPALLVVLLSLPFLLVNPGARFRVRAAQTLAALALISLPPLGFIGWLNPLFVSASLFPGLGLGGLVLAGVGFACVAALRRPAPWRQIAPVTLLWLVLPVLANVPVHTRIAGPSVLGLAVANTRLGKPSEALDYRRSAWRLIRDRAAFHSGVDARLLVFPESILHGFGDLDVVGLAPIAGLHGAPEIWIGATREADDGRVDNVIVRPDGSVVARNRLPVPIGNWRPFMASGVVADPFGSDLVEARDLRIAISICYEHGVLWPHPGLLTGNADALVAIANHWALAGTRTARAQQVAAVALARMADVPLTWSSNQ